MLRRSITGVVLCGGAGRRFGGRDKPLARLHGRPLVEHVLRRLEGQVSEIVISANRNLEVYRECGYPVVSDEIEDGGPLAGVFAAATVCKTDQIFVCPGDSPLLPPDLVARMQRLLADEVAAVVPIEAGRRQHLFMLARRAHALTIRDYLDQGHRSVYGWLEGLRVVELPIDDERAFLNINTPEELAALERSGLAIGPHLD